MKIGLVVPGFSSGPGDWCIPALTNLARSLAARSGVELHVYTLRYPHRAGTYQLNGATVHAIGGGAIHGRRLRGASGAVLWASFLAEVRREHNRAPFWLLHGFWATESGWLAALAGRALSIPTLVHLAGGELVHDRAVDYGNASPGISRLLVSLSLRLTSGITVPSTPMRAALLRRDPSYAAKTHDWHFGVPAGVGGQGTGDGEWKSGVGDRGEYSIRTTQARRDNSELKSLALIAAKAQNSKLRLIHVASLVPVKAQAVILDALARAKAGAASGAGPTLTIVGSGPLEGALRQRAVLLRLGEAVSFLGERDHGELPGLYREHDAFVLASRHEAQCMALLEAAACGLPWIAPPVGAVADLALAEAPSGWLVPRADAEAIARAILVATEPAERERRGAAARSRVLRDYNLETQTDRLLELYAGI